MWSSLDSELQLALIVSLAALPPAASRGNRGGRGQLVEHLNYKPAYRDWLQAVLTRRVLRVIRYGYCHQNALESLPWNRMRIVIIIIAIIQRVNGSYLLIEPGSHPLKRGGSSRFKAFLRWLSPSGETTKGFSECINYTIFMVLWVDQIDIEGDSDNFLRVQLWCFNSY